LVFVSTLRFPSHSQKDTILMKTNKGQIDLARINFISNTFKNLVVALQSTHTENTVNTVKS